MQLSVLHSFAGDNEIDFDVTTEEGRKKLGEVLNKLLKAGTAIFLERAEKTYRVTGWDPETDRLVVQNPSRWPTGEARHALPAPEGVDTPQIPEAAESLAEEKPAPKRGRGRPKEVRASTSRGRLTGVARSAGG